MLRKVQLASLAIVLPLVLAACGKDEIEGVRTFEHDGGQHQTGRISYPQTPPAGGAHNATWQNCGVYERPIYDEFAVHSLEHGAVWIAYRPDVPAEDVTRLRSLVDGRPYTLLAPYPGLSSPVVATAWNRQLAVDGANDPRLERFVEEFEQGKQAPERGAACSNGTSETR